MQNTNNINQPTNVNHSQQQPGTQLDQLAANLMHQQQQQNELTQQNQLVVGSVEQHQESSQQFIPTTLNVQWSNANCNQPKGKVFVSYKVQKCLI